MHFLPRVRYPFAGGPCGGFWQYGETEEEPWCPLWLIAGIRGEAAQRGFWEANTHITDISLWVNDLADEPNMCDTDLQFAGHHDGEENRIFAERRVCATRFLVTFEGGVQKTLHPHKDKTVTVYGASRQHGLQCTDPLATRGPGFHKERQAHEQLQLLKVD